MAKHVWSKHPDQYISNTGARLDETENRDQRNDGNDDLQHMEDKQTGRSTQGKCRD